MDSGFLLAMRGLTWSNLRRDQSTRVNMLMRLVMGLILVCMAGCHASRGQGGAKLVPAMRTHATSLSNLVGRWESITTTNAEVVAWDATHETTPLAPPFSRELSFPAPIRWAFVILHHGQCLDDEDCIGELQLKWPNRSDWWVPPHGAFRVTKHRIIVGPPAQCWLFHYQLLDQETLRVEMQFSPHETKRFSAILRRVQGFEPVIYWKEAWDEMKGSK